MEGSRFPAKPPLGQVDAAAASVSSTPASGPMGDGGTQRSGATAADGGQLVTLQLTPEQLHHLAFAVLCQVEGLLDGEEANEPEVLEAIRHLEAVQRMLDGGQA